MTTASETFARFVSDIELDQIPPDVIATSKLVFLDIIGVALAASRSESGRMAIALARTLEGKPESQVIGTEFRTSASSAVLANGTLAHALDFDETLEAGIIHAGCCVVPAALAVGEACGASGRSVLAAAVAGFEVMFKIGAAAPGGFHARGFHPTAITAPFGAAAVAGRLYKLSTGQLVNALGIAGSQSSGITEYLADGSWTKQFHAGWGAHAGIVASLLAKQGFHGPRSVFEGQHGVFLAFATPESIHLDRLNDVGREWHLPKVVFKLYPCGSIAHPYIDCALRIRNAGAIRLEDIDRIVCRTHPGPVPRLWEPLEMKRQPPTPYAAKFSLPYVVAAALVKGRVGLEEFSEDSIRDRDTLALARKVSYELDPSLDYPRHFSGHVKVVLKGGQVIADNQPHARGSVEAPIAPEEIELKFRHTAGHVLAPSKVDRVVDFLRQLEHQPDVSELSSLLAVSADVSLTGSAMSD
jgi:2-methylcitrate dehydratase PrpD